MEFFAPPILSLHSTTTKRAPPPRLTSPIDLAACEALHCSLWLTAGKLPASLFLFPLSPHAGNYFWERGKAGLGEWEGLLRGWGWEVYFGDGGEGGFEGGLRLMWLCGMTFFPGNWG